MQIDVEPTGLSVTFADGTTAAFNRFWLRDNCPSEGDRRSLFRSFSVADMADDLRVVDATATDDGSSVVITFSDGVSDEFTTDWLRTQLERRRTEATGVDTWRTGHEVDVVSFDALERGNDHHLRLVEAVARFGVALVTDLPTDSGAEDIARFLGPIRETDFGRVFDIITEPDAFTPSQTDDELDPHTDDPYRYSPAGISILHCVVPSAGGGASTIVDGFAIAEDIAQVSPTDFELLATVTVDFAHRRDDVVDQGDDVHLIASAPIIARDTRTGRVNGIRFHERAMDCLPIDPELAERFYPALRRFARATRGNSYRWRKVLEAGEALVYDNQRVLHGRSAFDGSISHRHLQVCTIDRDQVHSRLRRLRELHGTGTHTDPLPSGNLA